MPSVVRYPKDELIRTMWGEPKENGEEAHIIGYKQNVVLRGKNRGREQVITVRVESRNQDMFRKRMDETILPSLAEIPLSLFRYVKTIVINSHEIPHFDGGWDNTSKSLRVYGFDETTTPRKLRKLFLHEMGHSGVEEFERRQGALEDEGCSGNRGRRYPSSQGFNYDDRTRLFQSKLSRDFSGWNKPPL